MWLLFENCDMGDLLSIMQDLRREAGTQSQLSAAALRFGMEEAGVQGPVFSSGAQPSFDIGQH